MIRSEMKNCNKILTEKQLYDPEKLINTNILQMKKCPLLIKEQ